MSADTIEQLREKLLNARKLLEQAKRKQLATDKELARIEQDRAHQYQNFAWANQMRLAAEAELAKSPANRDDPRVALLQKEIDFLRALLQRKQSELDEQREPQYGALTRQVFNKIVRCLHPDSRPHVSAAEFDEACGLMTQSYQNGGNPIKRMPRMRRRWE